MNYQNVMNQEKIMRILRNIESNSYFLEKERCNVDKHKFHANQHVKIFIE